MLLTQPSKREKKEKGEGIPGSGDYCASNAGGISSIPGWGTKIPPAMEPKKERKRKVHGGHPYTSPPGHLPSSPSCAFCWWLHPAWDPFLDDLGASKTGCFNCMLSLVLNFM